MKRIQSTLSRALGSRLQPPSAPRRKRFAVLAIAVLVCCIFIAVPTFFVAHGNMQKGAPPPPQEQKGPENGITLVPQVGQCVAFAETIPVRDFGPAQPETNKESVLKPLGDAEVNEKNTERVKQVIAGGKGGSSSGIQNSTVKEPKIPAPIVSFDGNISNDNQTAFGFRVEPPDTNGDVGPNHYVQTTNLLVGIYNKATGALIVPKFKMSSLFAAVGAPCASRDDGDPIVVYDQLADRWLLSQFCTASQGGRTSQLIAISKTGDPTGAYFVYNFVMPNTKFNDYPHFGVWPDAYYMTDNQFTGNSFTGAGAFAFDRAKLLVGDPTATFIYFDEFAIDPTLGGQLPTDLDGYVTPPVGTPNLFMEFRATEFGDPLDALRIFAFHADFVTPLSSTFTQVGTDLALASFDANAPGARTAIEQPPPATSGTFVDAIADRLMYRLTCRILAGGVQSYVGNFTVNVSGAAGTTAATYQAGIKWFELRRNSGTGAMSVNQQGIYAPGGGDGVNGRNIWMGSINQDNEGNIGLGFSASSLTLFPSVLYTGRLVGDPAGTLPQGEGTIVAGGGSQQDTAARWGDYSALSVDPVDDCTFWYTQEYYAASGSFSWNTRIGSFKVNTNCVPSQRGNINGTITNCGTGQPILNATVRTPDGFFRQTNASGQFSMTVAPGTYTVNVTAAGGFGTCTQQVTVANGGTATVNCCLAPSAIIVSAGAALVAESCTPPNGVLDPGEQVTVSFCVQNTGGANTTNLVGTLANTGGVTGASGPQNYGVVVAGGPAVCRNFTFTVAGTCGGTVTASIQFQDGATNLGTLTYTFTLGVLNTVFSENFDGVVAPALPAGWVATQGANVTGAPFWVTSSAGTPAPPADTAPNAIFSTDPSNILDNRIDTPAIAIASSTAKLTFRHNFSLESTFDGGVVEISIPSVNAGAFQDIITAGGSFVAGTQAYTGPISVNFGSPIAGRQAFSGTSAGFVTTSINMPPAAAGQSIKLRFREASDNSVSQVGWRVDTVSITDGFVCSQNCSVVVPCAENFDMVTPPALPAGWSATVAATCVNTARWVTVSTTSDTAPNSAFVNDPNCISDERLDSKPFPIVSATAQLTFRRNNNLESGFDGMVLEISNPAVNAGAFQDIITAGGSFVTGGYNATISVNFGSPIAGRMAWSGNSAGFVTTTVNLPANANGQSIVLRWRRGSDSSVSGVGAFIDTISITGSNCAAVACTITCPANITQSNDPNQCGAVVTYPAPTTTGTCGTVTCSPASGSFFPKGTTTVTCTTTAGPSCSFTVTVNDTQPPTITCPPNQTAVTDQSACVTGACATVNFPPPVATDNCPGVIVACVPPSGSCLFAGVTTVTCTATDASGNTATCSFTITTFDVALQDDSDPTIILLWNSFNGSYRFCCNGTTFTGVAKATKQGCVFTLDGTAPDRRILGRVDKAVHAGTASLQFPPGTTRCTITDRNTLNDTNLICQ
jgi:hypothetical protein